MEIRPRLTIPLSKTDKFLEMLCATLLMVLWIGTLAFFSKLPATIPSHFNAAGQADNYSNKGSIFILPIVATIIYIGMSLLNRRPHLYNYLTTVTVDNAKHLYTTATKLIRVLKLAVVIIFSGIVFMTYRTVFTNSNGLGPWFLPVALGLMILPSIFYLLQSSKPK